MLSNDGEHGTNLIRSLDELSILIRQSKTKTLTQSPDIEVIVFIKFVS